MTSYRPHFAFIIPIFGVITSILPPLMISARGVRPLPLATPVRHSTQPYIMSEKLSFAYKSWNFSDNWPQTEMWQTYQMYASPSWLILSAGISRTLNKSKYLGGTAVRRRTRDRKVASSTPGRGAIKSTRSTQPSIPPG